MHVVVRVVCVSAERPRPAEWNATAKTDTCNEYGQRAKRWQYVTKRRVKMSAGRVAPAPHAHRRTPRRALRRSPRRRTLRTRARPVRSPPTPVHC
ncbi:unnamed protein product [Colias eurytheme]|nr:unnamed protein product [Colias eurytheme]